MDDLTQFMYQKPPTAARPLLGMTILVVEDSRYTCEVLRLMCLRSGARIRRADCLAAAARHLKTYRPSAVIIDMGLPDGAGEDLILDLDQCHPRVGVILGMSGDDGNEARALAAGANGFLPKPLESLAQFQETILAALPPEARPTGPRALNDTVIEPDLSAYRDDMSHVATLLEGSQDGLVLDYAAQFLEGVARSVQDDQLAAAAHDLAECTPGKGRRRARASQLISMVQERLEERIAI